MKISVKREKCSTVSLIVKANTAQRLPALLRRGHIRRNVAAVGGRDFAPRCGQTAAAMIITNKAGVCAYRLSGPCHIGHYPETELTQGFYRARRQRRDS